MPVWTIRPPQRRPEFWELLGLERPLQVVRNPQPRPRSAPRPVRTAARRRRGSGMVACVRAFTGADGTQYLDGRGPRRAVTRVSADHPILKTHGANFA